MARVWFRSHLIVTDGLTEMLVNFISIFRVSCTIISKIESFSEEDMGNLSSISFGNLRLRKSWMERAFAISLISPMLIVNASVDLIRELEKSIEYRLGSNNPIASLNSF